MSRPLRVAMVGLRAPWGTEGGVEQVVGQLAPRLVELGHEVTVYCRRRYNPLGEGVFQGVRLVDLDTLYTRHLEAIVHTALALPPALLGADVVHVHATGPALLAWLPRLAGRATVVTVHGLDWKRDKWGKPARAALWAGAWAAGAFPHRVITVSEHLGARYRATWGDKVVHIPNGVPPIPEEALASSGVPGLQVGKYLLFVGRLVPEKGLDQLLAAYATLADPLPLVIVGGSTYTEDHAARLRAHAPRGVIFTGPLFGQARDALLTHARAFVYPSRVEGLPVAPMEAMDAGRPVLLSDIPPHREILAFGGDRVGGGPRRVEAGWLVPPTGWAGALAELAATPEGELEAMGAAGRVAVRARFSWDRIAERTLVVYQEALASSRRRDFG